MNIVTTDYGHGNYFRLEIWKDCKYKDNKIWRAALPTLLQILQKFQQMNEISFCYEDTTFQNSFTIFLHVQDFQICTE